MHAIVDRYRQFKRTRINFHFTYFLVIILTHHKTTELTTTLFISYAIQSHLPAIKITKFILNENIAFNKNQL